MNPNAHNERAQNGQHELSESLQKCSIRKMRDIYEATESKVDQSKRKQKVCIYWMQGNCRFSDQECSYLHAAVEEKKAVCKWFKEQGYCSKGSECLFRHVLTPNENPAIEPNGHSEQCPYYERGFCHKGQECKFLRSDMTHQQLATVPLMLTMLSNQVVNDAYASFQLCPEYAAGFCPRGPHCKQRHLKSVVIDEQTSLKELANFPDEENWVQNTAMPLQGKLTGSKLSFGAPPKPPICHQCGVEGHKSTYCQGDKIDRVELQKITQFGHERVLCFNCSQYGHYASLCPLKKENGGPGHQTTSGQPGQAVFTDMPPPDAPEGGSLLGKRAKSGLSSKVESALRSKQEILEKGQHDTGAVVKRRTVTLTGHQVNLRDLKNLPFSHDDVNQAIRELAAQIQGKKTAV